jgi:putative nucleotidyltransferase with HDIG domain
MRFHFFGRHLHNQIVIPLLVVSACIAVVATAVGVYALQDLIEKWVGGNAVQAIQTVEAQFTETARRLQADAKFAAQQSEVEAGVPVADWAAVQLGLAKTRANTVVDDLIVLDENGVVVAQVGTTPIGIGSRPLGGQFDQYATVDTGYSTFLSLPGTGTSGPVDLVAAISRNTYQVGGTPKTYTVVATRAINEAFLQSALRGVAAAVGFGETSLTIRSSYADRGAASRPGQTLSDADYEAFRQAVGPSSRTAASALGSPGQAVLFAVADQQYAALAAEIGFSGDAAAGRSGVVDPTGTKAYVVVVVSNAVASDAGRATIWLMTFWSIVAVLVLTGLGAIVARQVSAPLAALSESARRVADGDFSARVDFDGVNEVAELADSFNAMTSSLQERTESLTKKVLELATLYEMSRALGSTLDLDVLLDSVLDSALRIFNVDSGYVMLRDKATGTLDLRAWRGMTAVRPDDRAIRSSMSDWVVRQGRPLIFNPPQDATAEEHVDSVTGALAALCVPLVSGEGVIGAICVGSRERDYRFSSDDVRLLSTIANHVTIAIGNIELFSSLQEAYLATVRSLAAAVDAKDPFTRGHSDRVALYAKAIAEKLDLSGEQCVALEMAAYLHDIGKIGIREAILLKPGKLDAEEMGQMRHHPLIGANILRPVAFPWPIAPVVRHHHEHYDGEGYPAGLKGEEIPLLARILTVADAYEAMTADRPYRGGRTQDDAIQELYRCQGSHFDPRIVETFIQALAEMDDRAAARRSKAVEEIQPEEARAIFVAVCDGMFASFRRLGGPRLASNLEVSVGAYFRENGMPYVLHNGHLTADWESAGTPEDQLQDMRDVVKRIATGMEATAGRSLVDHFYDEAVAGLSDRMRYLSQVLDLYDRE